MNLEQDPDLFDDLLNGVQIDFCRDFDFDQIYYFMLHAGIEVEMIFNWHVVYPELQRDNWSDPDAKEYKVDTIRHLLSASNAAGQELTLCKYPDFFTWALKEDSDDFADEDAVNEAISKFILHHIYATA